MMFKDKYYSILILNLYGDDRFLTLADRLNLHVEERCYPRKKCIKLLSGNTSIWSLVNDAVVTEAVSVPSLVA